MKRTLIDPARRNDCFCELSGGVEGGTVPADREGMLADGSDGCEPAGRILMGGTRSWTEYGRHGSGWTGRAGHWERVKNEHGPLICRNASGPGGRLGRGTGETKRACAGLRLSSLEWVAVF